MTTSAVTFCLILQFESVAARIAFIAAGIVALKATFIAGFLMTYNDVAGPYTGLVYGISTSFSAIPAFAIPSVVATLVPDSGDDVGKDQGWQRVFYSSAAVLMVGAIAYLAFGTTDRLEWIRRQEEEEKKKEAEADANRSTATEMETIESSKL